MPLAEDVARLRDFNRFYTRRIGLLNEAHLDSGFSLTEVRVLFELDRAGAVTARALGETLDLDAGYLSRIVKRFEAAGLIARTPDPDDGRSHRLSLTEQGRGAFLPVNARSDVETGRLIAPLGEAGRARLGRALGDIRLLLEGQGEAGEVTFRSHRSGDMGWIVQRHGVLYAAEHGWPPAFEGFCAQVCAGFVLNFDAALERCWIAERRGEPLGTVMLTKGDAPGEAKLRLLLLEPSARGLGLGRRLVRACIEEARARGYGRLSLWTQSTLTAARAIYAGEGFVLASSQPHALWGVELVGETWTLDL